MTEMLAYHRRLFAYDRWANREALAALRGTGAAGPPPHALRLLGHVLGAERLWLARLDRQLPPPPVWPDLSLAGCEREIAGLERLWETWRRRLAPEALVGRVAYVNTRGEPWESTVGDILTHVVMHSAYHRGQIAAELRAAGHVPATTDFIHATRRGLVE